MSTGADCWFQEIEPGKWIYHLQDWPYGAWEEYSKYGPFDSFKKASDHLRANHANPGGYSTQTHPTGHVHEWTRAPWTGDGVECEGCGRPQGPRGDCMSAHYASVGWTVGDILDVSEDWVEPLTDDEAEDFLANNARYIQDAMVEAGWQVIHVLLGHDYTVRTHPAE